MQRNAVKLTAEQEVAKARKEFGQQIPMHPAEALLATLQLSVGQIAWLQYQLEETSEKGSFEGQVLMRLWGEERDRVTRISEAALRAGVQERYIRLAEQYGLAIAKLIERILDDPELGLGEVSSEVKGVVVRRHLLALRQEEAEREREALSAAVAGDASRRPLHGG